MTSIWSGPDMAEQVVIVAMGASTPVGRDAWSSAAAVRAGISGFVQHPYMMDAVGAPMHAAIAPWLEIDLSGVDRLEALLSPALDQVLAPIASLPRERIAIALGLPSPRLGLPDDVVAQLMGRISARHTKRFGSAASFSAGHAGGLAALHAATNKLLQGGVDACVVAGVDSYIEPLTLEWLEDCDQLHGAGRLNNAWGFIPGEAGAALLLMRATTARELGLQALSMVLGAGTAVEPKHIKSGAVCLGEGLTQAFRSALSAVPVGARVSDVYGDMNGEPYRADEFGFAVLRTKDYFESASDFVAPADIWGDVGAAGGALHIMLATVAGYKGYAKGPLAFAWASAEAGERAAALVATRARG
jgi:3-oxoacyl-[acyl-carrier-protein] synthase-1